MIRDVFGQLRKVRGRLADGGDHLRDVGDRLRSVSNTAFYGVGRPCSGADRLLFG